MRKRYWNNPTFDMGQVRLLACAILAVALLATMTGPSKVHAQDLADQARTEISNAEYKINDVSSTLMTYWNNMSAEAQRDASNDTSLALADLQYARVHLEVGWYNESLQEACQAMYQAGQCEYQVYLSMANLKIEEANKTISNIPWYLDKPWYAKDILQNATTEYEAQNTSDFTTMPSDDNVSVLARLVQNLVSDRIEGQAIPHLFSNPDSAYNLALKAENLTASYVDEQSSIFWAFFSIGVTALCGTFLIGLVVGVLRGERIRHRFSAWRSKSRSVPAEAMSQKERSVLIMIIEASGLIVTALFTIGALTGAVMQQVKYVYEFIGYMFAYALSFIFSAVTGILSLYTDERRKRLIDPFDLTVTLFVSGWLSFAFLFGLALAYESLPPNFYFVTSIPYLAFVFMIDFILSFVVVYVLKRTTGKFSRARKQNLKANLGPKL